MFKRLYTLRFASCAALLLVLLGCEQKMEQAPYYKPFEPGALFADSMSARPVIDGTVPRSYTWFYERGAFEADTAGVEASLVTAFPFPITGQVLKRGRQRYDIYCAPCHGRAGYGRGMVVLRGLRAPPSFHTDRLREAPVGHYYDVITNGYGAMYSYAGRLKPADRWAVTAYIRALQLSQNAPGDILRETPSPQPSPARGEGDPGEQQREGATAGTMGEQQRERAAPNNNARNNVPSPLAGEGQGEGATAGTMGEQQRDGAAQEL